MSRNRESNLKRVVGKRQPRKTLMIFCEVTKTEPEYFKALKRQPWVRDVASVDLLVDTSRGMESVPTSLVPLAIKVRSQDRDEGNEIDEFWCVFDVEWPVNHPGLMEACIKAKNNGIKLAISNPCFELWLAIHFQDQTAWLDNDHACRLIRVLDKSYSKKIDGTKYMPNIHDAAKRAEDLDKLHKGNSTVFPSDNPSSGMYNLIRTISEK